MNEKDNALQIIPDREEILPVEKNEVALITSQNTAKDKVIELRVSVMQGLLKDTTLKNEDFVNLSPADKITVTNEMKKIIAANPDIYGERSEIADQLGDISPHEERTLGDNLKSFGNELADQAKIKGGRIFFIAATVSIIAGAFVIVRPFLGKK